jgi:serine-type D-Ala-D-Ala carboxypeptidase
MASLRAAPVIADLITAAIADHCFPGAVVLASRGGVVQHHAAYGTTMYDQAGSLLVTAETIYDIASLTKIITVTAFLRLYEAFHLDLDTPAATFLPELHARTVTLRHLLSHTSGLDVRLSHAAQAGASALWQAVFQAPLCQPAGSVAAYTNINTLLIGEIVARLAACPLDRALTQLVLQPLQMHNTQFNPPAILQQQIAPSELDDTWRKACVHGVVHDESAYVLGGVAGHAGLFSNAIDLQRFCQAWLEPGHLLQQATIAESIRNHAPNGGIACGLGWMLARPNFMGQAAATCIGHTGFTGPALVLQPATNTALVFLCNRTFPKRTIPRHHAVIAQIVEHLSE